MDVLISPTRDPSSGVSVFTTKPSIDYGLASDYDESSNAVFDTNNNTVAAGDYIFVSMDSLPSPAVGNFTIYVIGEI